jgi:NADPH-dependent 2,4-dienoyl-CoA reductase/sulfur reductase-like enzyme
MATANHHKVVIVGGGAAGMAVAARLTKQVDDIVVIDPSEKHYYQPLWTLVGGGCVKRETTERNESSVIPKGVTWIKDAVTTVDPDNNSVETAEGKTIGYDVMVICPGIQLTSEELGGRLFDSLHGQLPTLPNSARVYPDTVPGHLAARTFRLRLGRRSARKVRTTTHWLP